MVTLDAVKSLLSRKQGHALDTSPRHGGALVFSGVIHVSVLAVLALSIVPTGTTGDLDVVIIQVAGTSDGFERPMVGDHRESFSILEIEPFDADLALGNELKELQLATVDRTAFSEPRLQSLSGLARDSTRETLTQASSIDAVADVLAEDVEERLQSNDLLVVWLLDASQSAFEDRGRRATGLRTFLRRFGDKSKHSHRLMNTVVSFGAETNERVAPTESMDRILDAANELTVDSSGTENVFRAVENCAVSYRRSWPHVDLLLIAWTDESGDDAERLEKTIQICRTHRVTVSVVGPSAVIGADTGKVPLKDPIADETHQLPVTRGPETALPERIELGYWYLTQSPVPTLETGSGFGTAELPSWFGAGNHSLGDHRCIAATDVTLPTWYGGNDLTGLLSGFGPYALTRLSSETGGKYILLEDDGVDLPFELEELRLYRPDYRSLETYLRETESRPLRKAVMEAVRLTRGKGLGPPPTLFFGRRSDEPPYRFMRYYLPPTRFASKLKAERRRLKSQANRTSDLVEKALAQVSQPETLQVGLEDEYKQETSRRWRAWYDLTRGRLLATSVRLEEYRKACDSMAQTGFLDASTNFVVLVPSRQMRSSSTYRSRAGEAERLLTRCIRANPRTPWAFLAQRELNYGLGVNVRQATTTLVTMPRGSTSQQAILPKL